MRTIERMIEVAFVGLFIGAVLFVVVMACTGQVYASHTGLGQQSNKPTNTKHHEQDFKNRWTIRDYRILRRG